MAEIFNIKTAPEGKPELAEIAHVTRDVNLQFWGYLGAKGGAALVNPDKVLARESGGLEIDLYEDLEDKDAHLACEIAKRRLAVAQLDYEILPGSPAPEAERIAARAREYVAWIPKLAEAIHHLADAALKGYAVAEIMWDASEGDVWIKDIIGRRQRRFVFDADGGLRLRTAQAMIAGEELPARKFLHHVFFGHRKDNPYGRGLGRVLFWPSWFKRNDIKFWILFCDKFGMPTALGKYPRGAQDPEINTLLTAMDAIQSRSGIAIPEGMAIELLEGQRAGSINTYQSLFEAMNAEESKAILGQTLSSSTGPTGGGSLALGQVHEAVRRDILLFDARSMAATLQEAVDWLVLYNFGDVGRGLWPVVRPAIDEPEDLNARASRDKTIIDAGVPVGVEYFYDAYGIPRPKAGEELASRSAPAPGNPFGFPASPVANSKSQNFAEAARRLTKANDKQERDMRAFVEGVSRDIAAAFRPQLQKIKDALAGAADFAGAKSITLEIPDPAFVDLLSRAMATADLLGREHILERAEETADFAEIIPKALAPLEAIEFFKKLKAVMRPGDLDAVDKLYDARAFRMAGAANQQVLDGIKSRIETALERGQTFADFLDSVDAMMDRLGVTRAAPNYLETVFETNMQQAYGAGRWQQLNEPGMEEVFPYYQYHTAGDDRVRPEHAAMDGFVARRDDPVWQKWWPPNDYRCRCSATAISRAEAEDLGLTQKHGWLGDDGKFFAASPAQKTFSPYKTDPRFAGNPGKEIFG